MSYTIKSIREQLKRTLFLHRAVRLVWQAAPGWTSVTILLALINGLLPLATLYLNKRVVDAIAAGMRASDKVTAIHEIAWLVLITGGVLLVGVLCSSLTGIIGEQQSTIVSDYIYSILHRKSIEVDLAYYENPGYHDTLHRAQREGPYRPNKIVNSLTQLAQNGVSLLAMGGLLLSFHWGVVVVLCIAVIPGIIVQMRQSHTMYDWQGKKTRIERKAMYYHWMITGQDFAKEVRMFGFGPLLIQKFADFREQLRQERFSIALRFAFEKLAAQALSGLPVFGAAAFIACRAVQGKMSIGDLVMYYQALQKGVSSLKQLFGGMVGFYEDNLFLNYLYKFLDLQTEITDPTEPAPFPQPIKNGIVFDQVRFQYPDTQRTVFENISLSLPAGKVIALVGDNGAGKTTLIKLLCRLYDPVTGKITLDGTDLRRFKSRALRHQISVIFQDYIKYNLTARENIRLGNIDLPPDTRRVKTAARHAGADAVISGLPHGYDTLLGKLFEEGEELSIGEWQKVALARAFLRDSQIIVLDEPTSSMDAKTEYDVFQKFRRLIGRRTAVLISHRFSTVRMADYIYVLGHGRVIEQGTHDELVQKGGTYARLFEVQAQQYR